MASQIGAPKVEEILTELVCSVCKDLFEEPKNMKNCPHTYCLRCVRRFFHFPPRSCRILCPQCGSTTQLTRQEGVSGLQTNVVVKNLVEKFKAKQAVLEQSTVVDCCFHVSPKVNRTECAHCGLKFCDACAPRHCEIVRKATDELVQSAAEKLVTGASYRDEAIASVNGFIGAYFNTLKIEVATIAESTKVAFERTLNSNLKRTVDALELVADSEAKRLRMVVEQLTDQGNLQSLRERDNNLKMLPPSQQRLPDAAELYRSFATRGELIRLLDTFLDGANSPLMSNTVVKEAMKEFQCVAISCLTCLRQLSNEQGKVENLNVDVNLNNNTTADAEIIDGEGDDSGQWDDNDEVSCKSGDDDDKSEEEGAASAADGLDLLDGEYVDGSEFDESQSAETVEEQDDDDNGTASTASLK